MTKRYYTCFLLLIFPLLLSAQLQLIETDKLRLMSYDIGHSYILPHTIRSFHHSLSFHQKLFEYQPTEKINLLIEDFGDYGNAGATAIPINFVSMGLSPFSYTFETSPAGERVFSMMNHELVHVTALDNATRSDLSFQRLFAGKVHPTKDHPISIIYSYLTSPRMYAPRWYHEGIAAYLETWMNGGIGLAMGSFDEMVFRTKVMDHSRIYSAQGLESEGVTSDFQGRSNSYLYGTRFMGYLAHTYGPDQVIEWVKRKNGSKAFFAGQFKKVFGLPIDHAWEAWIEFEKEWQTANVESINENPITQGRRITDRQMGSVSYPQYDRIRNKIYVAVNYPGQYPHLASIDLDNGQVERITDIKGPALFYVSSVTYDAERNLLFFTSDNNAWRDLNSYNLITGETTLLQRDFRTGDLAFNKIDKSIWGIKHLNGISTIVRIPKQEETAPEYSTWEQILTLQYGQDIFDIDISPDGQLLSAAVSDLRGNQSLLLYDLAQLLDGSVNIDTIFNFEVSSPQSFRFTEDGKYLLGCSYYSGVSNIFRVDMASRDIVPMSNAVTGLFRPLQLDGDRIFAFEYGSEGFVPIILDNERVESVSSIDFLGNKTVDKYPVLKDWVLPIAATQEIDIDTLVIRETQYRPGEMINLNYGYPTIIGYKDNLGLGYKFNMSDPLHFRELNLQFSYTPLSWTTGSSNSIDSTFTDLEDNERYHLSFSGRFKNITIHGAYNEVDFYDLFGPTKRSTKGLSLGLDFNHSLIWDLPRKLDLDLGVDVYYGLDRSPQFQQIVSGAFDETFYTDFNASLSYSFLKKSLGAVEDEKGIEMGLGVSIAQSEGNLFPKLEANLDYGIQLPLRHSSLWFRAAGGSSFKEEFNPFTRFAFAAFGNNYVDHHEYKRYRSSYSFPGLGFDEDFSIIARDYFKASAEMVFPALRFRKFGGFNYFANWVQASAFSSFLAINEPLIEGKQFANLGAQIDLRMVMFSHLPVTLSFGYANAWELDGSHHFNEWMISLKILD